MAPSLMWSNTGIVQPDLVTPEAWEKWYTDEHAPEIASIPGW
jgi:hypothetical protein